MKAISQFGFAPNLFISLSDRAFSLFLDSDSGNVFLDEGDGEDRINGAILFGHKKPVFVVEEKREVVQVWVRYCEMDHLLGDAVDKPMAQDWVRTANERLTRNPNPKQKPYLEDINVSLVKSCDETVN